MRPLTMRTDLLLSGEGENTFYLAMFLLTGFKCPVNFAKPGTQIVIAVRLRWGGLGYDAIRRNENAYLRQGHIAKTFPLICLASSWLSFRLGHLAATE